jgi:hypothetical protein
MLDNLQQVAESVHALKAKRIEFAVFNIDGSLIQRMRGAGAFAG